MTINDVLTFLRALFRVRSGKMCRRKRSTHRFRSAQKKACHQPKELAAAAAAVLRHRLPGVAKESSSGNKMQLKAAAMIPLAEMSRRRFFSFALEMKRRVSRAMRRKKRPGTGASERSDGANRFARSLQLLAPHAGT